MRLAIMQPYLFPYMGYFQLINCADTFVIFDDVNYIRGGWINRNRVLFEGSDQLFTLKLDGASPNKLINEIRISVHLSNREDLCRTIKQCYSKAPQYKAVIDLLEEIILNKENDLSRYIEFSLKQICKYMGIKTRLLISSTIDKDISFRGQDRIIDMAKRLGADEYLNSIGGKGLYARDAFLKNGIKLFFLKMHNLRYRQFNGQFIKDLSIIDAMMFNSKNDISELLCEYDLV